MKLLFVSQLYPSSASPQKASYNRQLMLAMARQAEIRIVAPVEWFPWQECLRGRVLPPTEEPLDGLHISHPRVFYTPGFMIYKHWWMYRRSISAHFKAVVEEFRPDHIIIGFVYPDGVAVAALCRELGIPYSLLVLGSDFRIRTRQEKFKSVVMSALREAPLVLCPGNALKRDMAAAGIDGRKIVAFNNGVNVDLFRFRTRKEALEEWSVVRQSSVSSEAASTWLPSTFHLPPSTRLCLFVGNLVPVKGPDLLLEAWGKLIRRDECGDLKLEAEAAASASGESTSESETQVSGFIPHLSPASPTLIFIGDGPMRKRLEQRAKSIGMGDSVVFLGSRSHNEIALWMNVADCLCLPSRSEGMPNVVLEALASGLPVVATGVGEVPFMIQDGENGFVIAAEGEGMSRRLAETLALALERKWERKKLSQRVENCTWDEAAETVLKAISPRQAASSAASTPGNPG